MGVLIIIHASSSVGFHRDRSIQARDALHCSLVQMGIDPFSLGVCELKGRYLVLHPCMIIGHHYHAMSTFAYIIVHMEPEQPKPGSDSYCNIVLNTGPPSVDGWPRYDMHRQTTLDPFSGYMNSVCDYRAALISDFSSPECLAKLKSDYVHSLRAVRWSIECFNRDLERLEKDLAGRTGLRYPPTLPGTSVDRSGNISTVQATTAFRGSNERPCWGPKEASRSERGGSVTVEATGDGIIETHLSSRTILGSKRRRKG